MTPKISKVLCPLFFCEATEGPLEMDACTFSGRNAAKRLENFVDRHAIAASLI